MLTKVTDSNIAELANKYTKPIVVEALSRGVTVQMFPFISQNYAILSLGEHREFISQGITNKTGYLSFKFTFNKGLVYEILDIYGFPIPKTLITNDKEDMLGLINEFGEVVIKPVDGTQGKGISVGVNTIEGLEKAVRVATKVSSNKQEAVVCQQVVDGFDHRVLVIDNKHIFVAMRDAAHVFGDGELTIQELIDKYNNKVGRVSTIKVGDGVKRYLNKRGKDLTHVVPRGEKQYVTNVANVARGARPIDLTDEVAPAITSRCIELSKQLGLGTVGVDIMTNDITDDREPYYFTELNPHPDITLHMNVEQGKNRNPAVAIVDMLFPETISQD